MEQFPKEKILDKVPARSIFAVRGEAQGYALQTEKGVKDGTPVADYPFTLSAHVRDRSGGHEHSGNRPTGRFITKENDTVTTLIDKTGSDGTVTYTYLSSGFGGVDSLRVRGKTERDTATATILLKMGDFEELTEGGHYKLVGRTTTHPRNHYGTPRLIQKVKALADSAYSDSLWILQYNDMSLIYGGPFDCTNNWNTPHQTHREGRNVDMRPKSTDGRKINKEWLERLVVKSLKGRVVEEDTTSMNNHFHITF